MKGHSIRISIGCVLLLCLVGAGCGLSQSARLQKRADAYYKAVMYNDYDTLYSYLSADMKARITRDEYIRFMEEEDTLSDFDSFEIDSVVIRDDVGKVRLKFTGGYWIFRDRRNVTTTWVKEKGKWYIQKDARGRFWNRFLRWISEERMRKVPELSLPLNQLSGQIERFARQYNAYPTDLNQVAKGEALIDPNAEGQPFRYRSDGATFWILAGNGPDGKADIDVSLFHGNAMEYPPPELVYDPLTGRGDLFRYGLNADDEY